ncbi:MAG: alanine--tRNA ligase [Candidatus Paceibacteria bacterium]
MTVSEIRKKYLNFFRERGHVIVPSALLVPENDPTTLFTSSGMQPLVPFLLGKPHPQGVRLADAQKSLRTQDIDEVGDNRHMTFFEMLGNWSLGDYFKNEQIPWLHTFLTDPEQGLGLDPKKLWVTCFEGDERLGIPKDEESADVWESLGIPKERIRFYGADKNWWSRSGEPVVMPVGEPGGPDSEVFFDFGTEHNPAFGDTCHPNCDCGRFMEIANSVFMEYIKRDDGTFAFLQQKNVDFGGGIERLAAATLGVADVFLIDTLQVLVNELDAASQKNYNDPEDKKSFRIIADHVRAATFLIADGVSPSNTDQGYVLRRLARRAIRHLDRLGVGEGMFVKLSEKVIESYRDHYPELDARRLAIHDSIRDEEQKFRKTLAQGMKEFQKLAKDGTISGRDAFMLFSTYGFPYELTEELAVEQNTTINRSEFEEEMKKHRETSRVGAGQKFKGGLADASEQTTKLHTATHLLLAGLRKYLGEHVHQAGSNITAERTRFDFTHGEKVSREILDKVEAYVNEAIQKGADVIIEKMPKEQAKAEGVEGSFWEKYPDNVNVYMVKAPDGTIYSHELCGGPHVENTKDMGLFKITKEEASAAGVRRVKAVLE